jgi:choline dehydrogenase-like flavoprotein
MTIVDAASSVVDPYLRVHDTPGLYVFGGAVFPTCPGVNPTLTMWALCYRAAERLVERLRRGDEWKLAWVFNSLGNGEPGHTSSVA